MAGPVGPQIKELVAKGSHRAKVSTISKDPRRYQAQCRDCTWKGVATSGNAIPAEALDHARQTVGSLKAANAPAVEEELNQEASVA